MSIIELRAKVAACQIERDRSHYLVECAARDVISANAHDGRLSVETLEAGWERIAQAKALYEPLLARHLITSRSLTVAKDKLTAKTGRPMLVPAS